MTRLEFFTELRTRLSGLAEADVQESLDFYDEMIADRMEEGMSEEEAVAAIGTPEEIAKQILSEMPIAKRITASVRSSSALRSPWVIALLAIGSPVWLSLLIAALAVVLSLYASLWSVIVSLWASFSVLVGSAVGGVLGGAVMAAVGNVPSGLFCIAAGLICSSLSILAFYGSLYATRGIWLLTKWIVVGLKHCFVKKGVAS